MPDPAQVNHSLKPNKGKRGPPKRSLEFKRSENKSLRRARGLPEHDYLLDTHLAIPRQRTTNASTIDEMDLPASAGSFGRGLARNTANQTR